MFNWRIMENRITITDCTKEKFDGFVRDITKICTLLNRKPSTSETPQDRLTLGFNNERVSVVWESKSKKLILTASEGTLREIKSVYSGDRVITAKNLGKPVEKMQNKRLEKPNKAKSTEKKSAQQKLEKKSETANPVEKKSAQQKPEDKNAPSKKITSQKITLKPTETVTKNLPSIDDILLEEARALGVKKKVILSEDGASALETFTAPTAKSQVIITASSKATQNKKSKSKSGSANKTQAPQPIEKSEKKGKEKVAKTDKANASAPISTKSKKTVKPVKANKEVPEKVLTTSVKLDEQKYRAVIKNLKSNKKLHLNFISESDALSQIEVVCAKKRALLTYKKAKRTFAVQTSSQELNSLIDDAVALQKDYKQAISSYIKLTGEEKKAGEIQKKLKKHLPDAFEFLSEQSKIDLAIGLIDILNEDVKLSDYSMLLVPPYRGLEKFIYDLQIAQNIEVKLIGQAFEKDSEGRYNLKAGYRRRIKSVVYNEVMSALYTEYYNKRNFYAHSDNSLNSSSRLISQKDQVKQIYLNLLELMNYNSKKLKEIGFSL